jgi:hypothetical protein
VSNRHHGAPASAGASGAYTTPARTLHGAQAAREWLATNPPVAALKQQLRVQYLACFGSGKGSPELAAYRVLVEAERQRQEVGA